MIREAVEDCAPPGSVTREDYLIPEFTAHAEALVRGIYATANRSRRHSEKPRRARQRAGSRRYEVIATCERRAPNRTDAVAKVPPSTARVWARLLCCTQCGARDADFVVTGERR
jgi:hypothetical protein